MKDEILKELEDFKTEIGKTRFLLRKDDIAEFIDNNLINFVASKTDSQLINYKHRIESRIKIMHKKFSIDKSLLNKRVDNIEHILFGNNPVKNSSHTWLSTGEHSSIFMENVCSDDGCYDVDIPDSGEKTFYIDEKGPHFG